MARASDSPLFGETAKGFYSRLVSGREPAAIQKHGRNDQKGDHDKQRFNRTGAAIRGDMKQAFNEVHNGLSF
jgi:hypothetical protein